MARQPKNQRNEMTEFESNLQSSGAFLLVLPVIATVLPLLGLQLRRLAKLGEFAPIGAMMVGLIGVGMICYARRNQGDAPLLGSAAALFVLFTGIGGFFMVSTLAPSHDDNSNRYSDSVRNTPSSNVEEAIAKAKAARGEFSKEARKRNEEFNQQIREQHNQMREESDRMMRQAEENHRRAMENMPSAPNFPKPNFGPGFGSRRN